jgi:hypothetical protein
MLGRHVSFETNAAWALLLPAFTDAFPGAFPGAPDVMPMSALRLLASSA